MPGSEFGGSSVRWMWLSDVSVETLVLYKNMTVTIQSLDQVYLKTVYTVCVSIRVLLPLRLLRVEQTKFFLIASFSLYANRLVQRDNRFATNIWSARKRKRKTGRTNKTAHQKIGEVVDTVNNTRSGRVDMSRAGAEFSIVFSPGCVQLVQVKTHL